jgi:hypothetical protein
LLCVTICGHSAEMSAFRHRFRAVCWFLVD